MGLFSSLSLCPPSQTWSCWDVLIPCDCQSHSPSAHTENLLFLLNNLTWKSRGDGGGRKRKRTRRISNFSVKLSDFLRVWFLTGPHFLHQQDDAKWSKSLLPRPGKEIPGTCATSRTPPSKTSPTGYLMCPFHPYHYLSFWVRILLLCETSPEKPERGRGRNSSLCNQGYFDTSFFFYKELHSNCLSHSNILKIAFCLICWLWRYTFKKPWITLFNN